MKKPGQLSLYETDRKRPLRRNLLKLAEFYRVTLDSLLLDASERTAVIRNYDASLREYQSLIGQLAALGEEISANRAVREPDIAKTKIRRNCLDT